VTLVREPVVWATQAEAYVVVNVGDAPVSVSLGEVEKPQRKCHSDGLPACSCTLRA
jgi:hypothetical protein